MNKARHFFGGGGPSFVQGLIMKQDLEEALDRTLAIANRRRAIRDELRAALQVHDNEAVVDCARRLMGVEDEEGNRSAPRIV